MDIKKFKFKNEACRVTYREQCDWNARIEKELGKTFVGEMNRYGGISRIESVVLSSTVQLPFTGLEVKRYLEEVPMNYNPEVESTNVQKPTEPDPNEVYAWAQSNGHVRHIPTLSTLTSLYLIEQHLSTLNKQKVEIEKELKEKLTDINNEIDFLTSEFDKLKGE